MTEMPTGVRRILNTIRGAGGEPSRLWLAGGALVAALMAFHSCASIEAGQVAVRVNNITGSMEVITQPGLIMRLPFGIHDVYIMDVSPQTFHMRGNVNVQPARREGAPGPRLRRLELRVQRHHDPVPRDSRQGRRDVARLRARPRVLRVDAALRARDLARRVRPRVDARGVESDDVRPGRRPRKAARQQAARRARRRGHEHRDAAPAVLEGVRRSDRGPQPGRECSSR